MSYRTLAALLTVFANCSLMLAQQADLTTPDPAAPYLAAAAGGPQSLQWSRLGVEDKLRYDARHFIDIDNFVFAGMGAAIDQWRDRPAEWGQGWGAFSERYGSHLGQYAIQRSIMFPVQAIDHEYARYFRSTRTSSKGRIGDALLHTVWRHNDTGGMMPAYSEFFGDYGAAALSRTWWPQRFRTGSAIFVAGSDPSLSTPGSMCCTNSRPI